jgi:hypothetical protein
MPALSEGVHPVFELLFKIGKNGRSSTASDMVTIAQMDTFSISIDGNVVEWSSFEAEGWLSRLVTGKALSITMSGKRCNGDPGNDYVAGMGFKTGNDCSTKMEVVFPSGATLTFDCVINVTNLEGGESRDVAPLEFECLSDGKPNFIAA